MAVVARQHECNESLDLGRECWFSSDAIELLQRACDHPRIGPDKVLAVLLADGLGLPLSLVAKVQHTTKNVIKTRVYVGRGQLRRLSERPVE